MEQIVQQFHPEKVILFGSRVWGEPTPDSDADLLVVVDTDLPPLRMAARIAASVSHSIPLDILVLTPQQLNQALQQGNQFECDILRKGILLYEAENA